MCPTRLARFEMPSKKSQVQTGGGQRTVSPTGTPVQSSDAVVSAVGVVERKVRNLEKRKVRKAVPLFLGGGGGK